MKWNARVSTSSRLSTRLINGEERRIGSMKGNEEDGGRGTESIEEMGMVIITREE